MSAAEQRRESIPPGACWRAFPWNPAAPAGAPFSASYVPPRQDSGRFDLGGAPAVLYLSESPEHAVGESIQAFRGRSIGDAHLRRAGWPIALVAVTLAPRLRDAIADLTEPAVLSRLGIRPDTLASHDRRRTRAIARAVHAEGAAGFRWWSALTGDWHGLVLFVDRVSAEEIEYDTPELVTLDHPAVLRAAGRLGVRLAGRRPGRRSTRGQAARKD